MIFIPPMEIATRIMTLIDNAQTELILVSPYINIDNWSKFKKCLQRAIDRGVNITIYARENATQNLETIKAFNLNVCLVKDLHAKIYLNEKYAIASSQNLIQYSDDNSIDFGYSTETEEERQQLRSFISQYMFANRPLKIAQPTSIVDVNEITIGHKAQHLILKDFEIRQIGEIFRSKFDNVRVNEKETYVYCSKLFPFGDLMIREGFEIRFKFRHKVSDALADFLENLDIQNNHYHYEKKKTLNLYNSSFIFIPQEVNDLQKLISDYIFMCKRIIGYNEKRIKIESPSEINLKFSPDDIDKTYKRLSNEFSNSKYKVNSKYLFCRDLLPFGDVMINNAYQIKIEMDHNDFKTIENTLLQMDFNFNYKYEMFLYQEHESRLYFNFRPLQWENLDFLISDYIDITKEILKKTENVVLN
ncbi:hypothetical protein [Flavobacterium sp. GNP001]